MVVGLIAQQSLRGQLLLQEERRRKCNCFTWPCFLQHIENVHTVYMIRFYTSLDQSNFFGSSHHLALWLKKKESPGQLLCNLCCVCTSFPYDFGGGWEGNYIFPIFVSWFAIRPTLDCPFLLEGITIPPPALKTISTNSSHLLTLPGYLAALLLLPLAPLFLCYARHSSTLLLTACASFAFLL